MVYLRINEREPNPNPHVNFITVLPMDDSTVEEAARQLLRALAAQVKPVMKAHGFVVNSLEEYEYNRVFAGRNWNHGETIELVLRSSTGSVLPTHWLMSTLCHELAHVKHMDHGPAFQALWRELQQEVRALQNRGYYGDGYWSSGTRLVDSARIASEGVEIGELPEYMCGGAHSRTRPNLSRRNRKPRGLQTSKKRKAGSRVNSSVFNTIGKALNDDLEGESKSHGAGFRKKAASKRARAERALAAERRLQAIQGKMPTSNQSVVEDGSGSEDKERDFEETDHRDDRRHTLLEVVGEKELDALRATMLDLTQDFLMPSAVPSGDHGYTHGPRSSANTTAPETAGGSSFGGRINPTLDDEAPLQRRKKRKISQSKLVSALPEGPWDCMVCTLANKPSHLACSACSTPRGNSKWIGDRVA